MRGGFLHNDVLIAAVERFFRGLGARVWQEYPVGPGGRGGFVDLFVECEAWRVAIEAELSAKRALNDLRKADALHVDLLLIVVPDPRTARAVHRRVSDVPCACEVWILPLGLALQRLSQKFSKKSGANVPPTTRTKNPGGQS